MATDLKLGLWPPAGIEWYYSDDAVAIAHADCNDILPRIKYKKIGLILTDPPYLEGDFSYLFLDLISITDNLVITPGKLRSFDWIKKCRPVYEYIWVSHTQSLGGSACLHIGFEPILVYKMPHTPLGTDLLDYPIAGSVSLPMVRHDDPNKHPHPKPENLILKLIRHWSVLNDVILDPFLGSGTTAFSAKKLGRKCIGIEISEAYCEIAANRCRQTVMNFDGRK